MQEEEKKELNRLTWEVEHCTRRLEKLEGIVAQLNANLREELDNEKEKCDKIFAIKPDLERIREVLYELRKVVYAVIGLICIGVAGAILKLVLK